MLAVAIVCLIVLSATIGLFFGRPFALLALCQGGVILFTLEQGGVF